MNYRVIFLSTIFVASVSCGNDAELDKTLTSETLQVFPNIKPYPDQAELADKNKSSEMKNSDEAVLEAKPPQETNEKPIEIPSKEELCIDKERRALDVISKTKPDLNVKNKQDEVFREVLPFVDPYPEESKNK